MRLAILSNSLPQSLPIYEALNRDPCNEVLIILFPASSKFGNGLLRHLARWFVKGKRWQSLRLVLLRRVLVFHAPLDHPQSIARLAQLRLDVGLHKSGSIYRQATIDCFRLGILNAHIGILPRYRGRSVMEWALIESRRVGISVFFVDEGIDTGERIVLSEEVNVSHCKSIAGAKQYLFSLDAGFYRQAIERLRSEDVTYQLNDRAQGRRFFVMSKLLEGVAEECLRIGNR